MKVSIIGGAGYVGLITGLGVASMGHKVIAVDVDELKVKNLQKGVSPIFEDHLESLLSFSNTNNDISFSNNSSSAIKNSDIIIISVGTPINAEGKIDLSQVRSVLKSLVENIISYSLIVIKSTLPITAVKMLKDELNKHHEEGKDFDIVSNPEFLREGRAIYDFYNPDRIVVGGDSSKSVEVLREFYTPLIERKLSIPDEITIEDKHIPFVKTNLPSAQMIKYGSNAFLANKISFVNEIAQICESVGANVNEVISGMGLDPRIGNSYMQPGPGFGGPCLEKDLNALVELGRHYDLEATFMNAILDRNERQVDLLRSKLNNIIHNVSKAQIAILGLAFKSGTDDTRNSASIKLIDKLLADGHTVTCYDPVAIYNVHNQNFTQYSDIYNCLQKADCMILMTEWEEFKSLDLKKTFEIMKGDTLLDMRNLFTRDEVESFGFKYVGIGY